MKFERKILINEAIKKKDALHKIELPLNEVSEMEDN